MPASKTTGHRLQNFIFLLDILRTILDSISLPPIPIASQSLSTNSGSSIYSNGYVLVNYLVKLSQQTFCGGLRKLSHRRILANNAMWLSAER